MLACHCTRTNFASIGNVVPQLHLHVVGRRQDDFCWPKPVWGNLNSGKVWTEANLTAVIAAVAEEIEVFSAMR